MPLGLFDNVSGMSTAERKEADEGVLETIVVSEAIQVMLDDMDDEIGLKAYKDELMT